MDELIGDRFVRAVADKDAAGLEALLRPDVDFRAMTPGRFWEATDAHAVVDEIMIGTWFSSERRITKILAIEAEVVSSLDRVGLLPHVNSSGNDDSLPHRESPGGLAC